MTALSIAFIVWALVALRGLELYFSERALLRRPPSEERLVALEKQVDDFRTAMNAIAARAMSRPR